MTSTDSTTIILYRGGHEPPSADCGNPERCLFEWYNWLVNERHTDDCPPGVSSFLHQFGMRLNDRLSDAKRQQLRKYLPSDGAPSPLDGTADDGLDETRVLIAASWALRTGARTWLARAGLDDEVAAIDAIPAFTDRDALRAALPAVRDLRGRLWAKRDAARTALQAKVRRKVAETRHAVAVAAAVAAAAAVAVAVAAAAAAADATWNQVYHAAYGAAKKVFTGRYSPLISEIEDSAIALYDVLITGEWPSGTD